MADAVVKRGFLICDDVAIKLTAIVAVEKTKSKTRIYVAAGDPDANFVVEIPFDEVLAFLTPPKKKKRKPPADGLPSKEALLLLEGK